MECSFEKNGRPTLVFKNTDQKNICATIVFKAESKPKHEETSFLGGFSSKIKIALFRGSKMVLFKSQISNCISAFVLYCKRKLHANFHKKNINIWAPCNFFEKENFDKCALVHMACALFKILELDF